MALPSLTLFGRSLLLIICEIAANAICWTVAGILFGKTNETRSILSLALLAWSLGLRHGASTVISTFRGILFTVKPFQSIGCRSYKVMTEFVEYKNAIDNATRGLIGHGQLPVTCGLFFSLGHSSIVVIITVAIAISSDVYKRIDGVGEVGGIVGAAVSGSFLFIIGLANTVILWRIIKSRHRDAALERRRANGEIVLDDIERNPKENHMLMMRILGPIITFVNRPWKMYPVGVLFGFGFDTASSVALLAVSAIARKGADGSSIPSAQIVILPLLFTAGMTLVDSADSVLMLYSYAGFPENSWNIFTTQASIERHSPDNAHNVPSSEELEDALVSDGKQMDEKYHVSSNTSPVNTTGSPEKTQDQGAEPVAAAGIREQERDVRLKMNVMSGLSIVLTLMSILVAFSISLITIMGLIGEHCKPCTESAEADDGHGGGLSGRWWRGWANANEQSGYIGAAIVGGFLLIVTAWYGTRWLRKRIKNKVEATPIAE